MQKKVRGSHILEVVCAYCKCFIATYQKVGESGFVKMYNERIIDGSLDFSQYLTAKQKAKVTVSGVV